jgi:methionine synthase II (cobalamin-independent)
MSLFRADHIGSLLRPKKLREAFRAGTELKKVQDECIRDVVTGSHH